ncbi:MAG: AI-2E family transporter [Firmicutes bacterium]|nr:AI-2E family transporter [Dethiobacter sp.]MBS3889098.1 AI-2E family transporter [Bacillota bacterium]
MLNSRPFRLAVWVLLLLLIALVGSRVPFLFRPLGMVMSAVFVPVVLSGLLYYWLSPVVKYLCRLRLPQSLAIVIVYGVILGALGVLIATTGTPLERQLTSMVNNAPRLMEILRLRLLALEENEWIVRLFGPEALALDGLADQVTALVSSLLATLGQNITHLIGMTTTVLTLLFLVPFILFYMLLDGEKLAPALVDYLLPARLHVEGKKILREMDRALSQYIQGQAVICIVVGILAFVGFLVIGMEYALLLAVVVAITNVVPYVGPIVGTIPVLIVGLVQSPSMAWLGLIVMLVVQQLESLVLSPRIMSKKLGSHPVVILFVMLIAGSLFGFWGIFLAVPTFAVLKVTIAHLYSLFLLYLHP